MVYSTEFRYQIFPDRPIGLDFDESDEHWDQIHFLFGSATLRAQAYEDAMAKFIVAANRKWGRTGRSDRQIWRLTLGQLHKEYIKYFANSIEMEPELRLVLKMRNSIAHKFYKNRMEKLETVEGRRLIAIELQEMVDKFRQKRDDVYWNLGMLEGRVYL